MRITRERIALYAGYPLLGWGAFGMALRRLDAISRWETVMSLRPYVGFLVNPWVLLAITLMGLASIEFRARHYIRNLSEAAQQINGSQLEER
jgi:hypothetical protein